MRAGRRAGAERRVGLGAVRAMNGTLQSVSTLFTTVGRPRQPRSAGNGGRAETVPRRPSSEASSAVSSPTTYEPAPSRDLDVEREAAAAGCRRRGRRRPARRGDRRLERAASSAGTRSGRRRSRAPRRPRSRRAPAPSSSSAGFCSSRYLVDVAAGVALVAVDDDELLGRRGRVARDELPLLRRPGSRRRRGRAGSRRAPRLEQLLGRQLRERVPQAPRSRRAGAAPARRGSTPTRARRPRGRGRRATRSRAPGPASTMSPSRNAGPEWQKPRHTVSPSDTEPSAAQPPRPTPSARSAAWTCAARPCASPPRRPSTQCRCRRARAGGRAAGRGRRSRSRRRRRSPRGGRRAAAARRRSASVTSPWSSTAWRRTSSAVGAPGPRSKRVSSSMRFFDTVRLRQYPQAALCRVVGLPAAGCGLAAEAPGRCRSTTQFGAARTRPSRREGSPQRCAALTRP